MKKSLPTQRWFLALQLLVMLSTARATSGHSSGCTSTLSSATQSMFSATSSSAGPGIPVLHGSDVWCAGFIDDQQFLIVDLGQEMTIDKVSVQGYPGTTKSVSQYMLYTSIDGSYYSAVRDGAQNKLFDGPLMDGDTVKTQDLPSAVRARFIKFNPREPLTQYTNNLCMRVDLLSCSPAAIDGGWTEWSEWSACPQSCYGVTTRYRSCTNPAPAYGGQSCNGQFSEDKFCFNNCQSPVDGDWSIWSPWSSCSQSCGTGSTTRTRSCTNPAPAHGGDDCVGSTSDTTACLDRYCPVNGDWSQWSSWTVCSLSCGGGVSTRARTCNNPVPQHGGSPCSGNSFEQYSCNNQDCPIDGSWSDWGVWSTCSHPCGGGSQSRSRSCDNPPPQHGGSACSGFGAENQQCNTQICPIHGGWSLWSSLSSCDKPCGGGKASRTRTCTNPAPQHGGNQCAGSASESFDCNLNTCPIPGGWSLWTSWSSCSKQCGGTQSRSRLCNSPSPAHGGAPCSGQNSQSQGCNNNCPGPVDGGWSMWESWSQCSHSCNGGSRSRSRTCTSPPPLHGGKPCQGSMQMNEQCNTQQCPVDGLWALWGSWSSCSATCGPGTKSRQRACTNPPPSSGGANCVGSNTIHMDCNEGTCPVDGRYSDWTQWSSCNVTCGGGSRVRIRRCDNPPPSSGGNNCIGDNFNSEVCNKNDCPVSGGWSDWSAWSTCDKSCDGGHQYRHRSCDNPPPASGGQPCHGLSVTSQACQAQSCPVDGGWSVWVYTPCDVPCGQGKRNRTRTCTNPPASGGGMPCSSGNHETLDCNAGPCPTTTGPPTNPPITSATTVVQTTTGQASQTTTVSVITATDAPTTPTPAIPEIDLVFVINVGGGDSATIFKLIKDTIKSIANKYGLASIKYSVIVYGSVATARIDFGSNFPDLNSFKSAIDSLGLNSGGPNLDQALERAKEVFNGPGARINSKKVIVVIGNQTPLSDSNKLMTLAKMLADLGIKIVSVGIGNVIDSKKLEEIATRGKDNLLIVTDINISPIILGEKIMVLVLKDDIPEIDLVFALSATSAQSAATYSLMKNTIKQIINRYGTDKIHYSIIVFGNVATTIIRFNNTFPISPAALKAAVDALPSTSGGPALDEALEEAKRLFDQAKARPNAKKILVVILDEKSGFSKNTLSTAVRPLENIGVLVISVGIGPRVDRNELQVLSPNPLDVIVVPSSENPAVLAVRIMERALRTNTPFIDLGFAISATSIDSDAIFSLMKEIIKAIIDRYGTDKVHVSIIVFGNVTTTSFNFGSTPPDQDQLKRDVDNLNSIPGPPNLEDALREASKLFQSITVRPNAKKVFVLLTDNSRSQDVAVLGNAAAQLRREGVMILSVGIGNQANQIGDQMKIVIITPSDYIGVPNYPTQRPVVIAELIMYKATLANIPEIDLTIALSATSVSSTRTFTLMQRTVNKIIQDYGINRIHYSIIVFGSVTTTSYNFSSTLPSKADLISLVDGLASNPGNPDLVKALEEVNRLYELQAVRPNAKKVLVVILDNASVNNASDLNRVVTVLVNKSVLIIGVGVGQTVSQSELQIITREIQNIIRVNVNKPAEELAKEIIQIILRTSGFSEWGQWGACSRTCRYLGIAGVQVRSRTCSSPEQGCVGDLTETRECNVVNCQGCGERDQLDDGLYTASSQLQPSAQPSSARLNTTNPSASQSAWCSSLNDNNKYLQLDLGETVRVWRVSTKGKEAAPQLWVTQYSVSYSPDGSSYSDYMEGGQIRVFSGNSDATTVVSNSLNLTTPVQYVRFHPTAWHQQQTSSPCMQVAVFGCNAAPIIGPTPGAAVGGAEGTGAGVLIALWILAGILTFLLLLACLWYCCRLCCGRGKKRRRLSSFRETATDTGYLLEQDKKWKLGQNVMAATTGQARREDEVQEVSLELKEEALKPSGVIQFGIEKEETKVGLNGKEQFVTAEAIHSETPVYSEDVGTIRSGASMATAGSGDTGYRSTERRKRIKSETRASVGDAHAGVASDEWSHRAEQRSGFTNGSYMRSQEWLAQPAAEARRHDVGMEDTRMRRSQSADELATVDYDMFERRRSSAQVGDSGGGVQMGRGGYSRLEQSGRRSVDMTDGGRRSVDMTDGGLRMGTVDVAIGGIGDMDMGRRPSRQYAVDEQEMVFMGDDGGRSMYTLDNGGYHTEEWYTRGGSGPGQLRDEGFKEIHVEHQPLYTEVQGDHQGYMYSRRV